jgi:hypothetical protein
MPKPVGIPTRILAYDREDKFEPQSIFVFQARAKAGTDVREAIKAAFRDWAETDAGREWIDDEGSNWGDALQIPDEFLRRHGIYSLLPDDYNIISMVVDHNEDLLAE